MAANSPARNSKGDASIPTSPDGKKVYDEATKLYRRKDDDGRSSLGPFRFSRLCQPQDLGAVYLKTNQLDKAEETLSQAIKLNGKCTCPNSTRVGLTASAKHKEAAVLSPRCATKSRSAKIHPQLTSLNRGRNGLSRRRVGKSTRTKGAETVDLQTSSHGHLEKSSFLRLWLRSR